MDRVTPEVLVTLDSLGPSEPQASLDLVDSPAVPTWVLVPHHARLSPHPGQKATHRPGGLEIQLTPCLCCFLAV